MFNQKLTKAAKPLSRGAIRCKIIRQQTPKWADRAAILAIYERMRLFTKVTGIQFSVDHDIPLQHPLVCGLHVENNLVIMRELDNQRKGNAWHPNQEDMFNGLHLPMQSLSDEEHLQALGVRVQDPKKMP